MVTEKDEEEGDKVIEKEGEEEVEEEEGKWRKGEGLSVLKYSNCLDIATFLLCHQHQNRNYSLNSN